MEMFFLGQNSEIIDEIPMLYQSQTHKEPTENSFIQYYCKFLGFRCEIMLEYMNDIDYLNMCINCTNPPMYHNGKKRRFIRAVFYSMPRK